MLFAIPQLGLLILGMARTTAFFVTNPVFSSTKVPALVKAGLSLFTAIVLWPVMLSSHMVIVDVWGYIEMILREMAVGFILGFAASIPYYALSVSGDAASLGMGFSMSRMTGANGEHLTHISQLYWVTFGLIFLTLRGHLWLFEVIGKSYDVVPLNAAQIMHEGMLAYIIWAITRLMILGLQIGLPVIGIAFLVDIAMALLAKSVPQFNVFFFGFPIKILVGLGTIFLLLSTQFDSVSIGLIDEMQQQIYEVLKGLASP